MSIDTTSAVTPAASRATAWSGRLLVLMGAGHLLGSLALTVRTHGGAWFGADLWSPDEGIIDMSPAMAAFWLTTGSFGAPLIVVGAMVLWLNRRGIAPPRFVALGLGAWSLTAAVILEPAPWLLVSLAAGLLLVAARRQRPFAEKCW